MNDTKAVAEFLGLDAATIEKAVTADVEGGVAVHIYTKPAGRECPSCGSADSEAKGRVRKPLRHALFIGRPALFVLHRRRFRCRSCGRTFYEPTALARKHAKVTSETERLAVEKLADYNATYASVAKSLHISPTAVIGIFDRRYDPPRKRLPRALCIDECYGKGQFKKPYCLMLLDWESGCLVDAIEGRDSATMRAYFFAVPEAERLAVEAVSIDMYEPYLDIARRYLKNAVVAVDSFHVMENLCRALDKVRRRVMNGHPKGSYPYHYLKKYAKLLFRSDVSRWDSRRKRDAAVNEWLSAYEARERALAVSDELRAAHEYYLAYKFFNSKPRPAEEAAASLDSLRRDASVAHIPEMAEFMQTLTNWRDYIVNSFFLEIGGRRMSNGPVEGFNSQYKKLMRVSNGVSNFARFRARLFLCSRKEFAFSPPKKGKTRKRMGRKRGSYKGRKGGAE